MAMRDIVNQHDDLMQRWKARLTEQAGKMPVYFNKDGIIDLEKWNAAPVKVMVLNRETNGKEKTYTLTVPMTLSMLCSGLLKEKRGGHAAIPYAFLVSGPMDS